MQSTCRVLSKSSGRSHCCRVPGPMEVNGQESLALWILHRETDLACIAGLAGKRWGRSVVEQMLEKCRLAPPR